MKPCKLLIPGLDFNLCDRCGYVPQQHQLDRLSKIIESTKSDKAKDELKIELRRATGIHDRCLLNKV